MNPHETTQEQRDAIARQLTAIREHRERAKYGRAFERPEGRVRPESSFADLVTRVAGLGGGALERTNAPRTRCPVCGAVEAPNESGRLVMTHDAVKHTAPTPVDVSPLRRPQRPHWTDEED